MSLSDQINIDIKQAMLAKEKEKLEALRAIKSALMLEATKGGGGSISEADELKILQKLLKQRKDAAEIYQQQNREDLAGEELKQVSFIEVYMPEQMNEEEVEAVVKEIITKTGANGPQDMGKVMGPVMGKLSGKADGKMISGVVKQLLSN